MQAPRVMAVKRANVYVARERLAHAISRTDSTAPHLPL